MVFKILLHIMPKYLPLNSNISQSWGSSYNMELQLFS